jgi:hypothetical protein
MEHVGNGKYSRRKELVPSLTRTEFNNNNNNDDAVIDLQPDANHM